MRLLRAAVAASLATAVVASGLAAAAPATASGFDVTVTRTEFGIPHITAKDYASLGYGYAYAFAQDDLCTMADDYVTVDGERSRFFGAGGTYLQRGNGYSSTNLDSDVFWKGVIGSGVVDRLVRTPAPMGPKAEVKQLATGYVAGWNRYLKDVGGSKGVPDARCRGKAWVRPISEATAYRRLYQLALLASSGVLVSGIAQAQPPAAGVVPALPAPLDVDTTARSIAGGFHLDIGSNAVALGKDATRGPNAGHGMLLGNPHFPWYGTERFYQSHLTIPGKLDVAGGSLYGAPLVLIGHTKSLAWSHTVSTARRFTPYQLTLVPGDPTSYLVDGVPTRMTSRTVSVQTATGPQTRTLWSTRYGPMVTELASVPLPWTSAVAYTIRDANADNLRLLNHFFDTDHAQSTAELQQVLNRYQGIPWVNTIASDRQGRALYADIGAVPNVPESLVSRCNTPLGVAVYQLARFPVLDGSTTRCDWLTDADSASPGLFGASHLPSLTRSDYVTNSNDSYWLANPAKPLTGFPLIVGDEGTARTLRTRIGLVMTKTRIDGTDGRTGKGFTRQDLQDLVFSDRSYAGEMGRADVVAMCRSFPGGQAPTSGGAPVAVDKACDALAAWDLHEDVRSRGSLLWRTFWSGALAATGGPWVHAFDAADPVHTPNTVNTASPLVQQAFGDAVASLAASGIDVSAQQGSYQYAQRGSLRIPVPGGPGDPEGQFNAISVRATGGKAGLVDPVHGSSFVQVVGWTSSEWPDARTILTYSQSDNPSSPHYADQTRLFTSKTWVTERFSPASVKGHAVSTVHLVGR
ncbi:MAG: hypothetical protein JWM64_1092 [Frankiales bacterium]|nr:hypothetical protein [Frankiales bacterium]